MLLLLSGCGKKSALEGKVVDVAGKPLAGISVVAKPVKEGKAAEAKSGPDGVFRFAKLNADTDYEIRPDFGVGDKGRAVTERSASVGKVKQMAPLFVLYAPTKDGLLVSTPVPGLFFLRDAGTLGQMSWEEAGKKVRELKVAGYSDWRLPTAGELRLIASSGGEAPFKTLNQEVFSNVREDVYWTSELNAENPELVWAVSMINGKAVNDRKKDQLYSVWPVRSEPGKSGADQESQPSPKP